jgi:hypothetical protein
MSVDTKSRPKKRLVDAIDSASMVRISPVRTKPVMRGTTTHAMISRRGRCLASEASQISVTLDNVTSRKEVVKEGRTKRCLYLFASWSVDAPYSWTYLKSRFIAIEQMTSAMEAARTNWGLIFTPSVSSSKKRSRPALDAGIGAFFFLLLIFGWLSYARCGAQ